LGKFKLFIAFKLFVTFNQGTLTTAQATLMHSSHGILI
jgi:hypothetical protein